MAPFLHNRIKLYPNKKTHTFQKKNFPSSQLLQILWNLPAPTRMLEEGTCHESNFLLKLLIK